MTYFFDLDNTLIDDDRAMEVYLERIFLQYQSILPYPAFDEFKQTWSAAVDRYFKKYIAREITFQEQRRHRIRDVFRLESPDLPLVDEILDNFVRYYEDAWCPYPDTLSTLQKVRPRKIGLITNGDSRQQRQKIASLGIGEFLDVICISSELGLSKPDPAIFRFACDKLGVSPAESYFVGDRIDLDVKGSFSAGMKPVWVNRKKAPAPLVPGLIVVDNLSGIPLDL